MSGSTLTDSVEQPHPAAIAPAAVVHPAQSAVAAAPAPPGPAATASSLGPTAREMTTSAQPRPMHSTPSTTAGELRPPDELRATIRQVLTNNLDEKTREDTNALVHFSIQQSMQIKKLKDQNEKLEDQNEKLENREQQRHQEDVKRLIKTVSGNTAHEKKFLDDAKNLRWTTGQISLLNGIAECAGRPQNEAKTTDLAQDPILRSAQQQLRNNGHGGSCVSSMHNRGSRASQAVDNIAQSSERLAAQILEGATRVVQDAGDGQPATAPPASRTERRGAAPPLVQGSQFSTPFIQNWLHETAEG